MANPNPTNTTTIPTLTSTPTPTPTPSPNPNLRPIRTTLPPLPPLPPSPLLHASFNQDGACFAAATASGFRIFNCSPFGEVFRRHFDASTSSPSPSASGIAAVEMLFRSNILALIGGSADPRFPPNKILIWDDQASRCIGELTFRAELLRVRLRRDRVVAVLENRVHVYKFLDLKPVHQFETVANPRGLCAVSQQEEGPMVLACLGDQKGMVRVEHYGLRKTRFVSAHESPVACLALSMDGSLLATASTKGTLIRVFSTQDGVLRQELRRGTERAEVYCLAFSADMQWLAASSDKGTVHVFSIKINLGPTSDTNSQPTSAPAQGPKAHPASSLSFMKGILPRYFNSEWSVAQFHLHEGLQYLVAFGEQPNTITIIGMDGSFFRCQFDPEAGGEMTMLERHNFVKRDSVS